MVINLDAIAENGQCLKDILEAKMLKNSHSLNLSNALPSGFDAFHAVPSVPYFGDASINLMNVDQMLMEMEGYYF